MKECHLRAGGNLCGALADLSVSLANVDEGKRKSQNDDNGHLPGGWILGGEGGSSGQKGG